MLAVGKKKYCPSCRRDLYVDDFNKDSSKGDGRQTRCRECQAAHRPAAEITNAQQKTRYWNNPELARTRHKRYTQKHRATRAKSDKLYRQMFPERCKAAQRNWSEANREKTRTYTNNRRARLIAAEGSYTEKEWTEKCEHYKNRCAYCRKKRKLTVQHVIPLSKGGSNYIANVVPACLSCNCSIGTKTVYPPEMCHS